MKRHSPVFLALLFSIFAILSNGCATDKAVISQAQSMDSQLKPAEMNDPALNDYLQQIVGVSNEEVGTQMIALQTRMQASMQTTAMLFQTSLINYLR